MDELPGDAEVPPPSPLADPPSWVSGGFVPPELSGPEAEALAAEKEALRQRIDAGAATPEELRVLAAQLREARQREDQLWRQEVRPALVKARKGRLRLGDLRDGPPAIDAPGDPAARSLGLGLAVLGAVLVVVLLATQSSALWVLLPLVGVLVYAWRQGRQTSGGPAAPPSGNDTPTP